MRILLVVDEYPWPPRTGYRQRIAGVLGLLANVAEVDLFVVAPGGRNHEPPPSDAPQHRLSVVSTPRRTDRRGTRVRRWVAGSQPRGLLWRDWTAPRAILPRWAEGRYDAVWFSHAATYLALGDLVPGPHVVDMDNLESFILLHRRAARHRDLRAVRPVGIPRAVGDAIDQRRWAAIERSIVERADAVVVCSELDRSRLGDASVFVVPNGYEPRADEFGEEPDTDPEPDRDETGAAETAARVLLFVGLLTYPPNRDAVSFFARRVLPLVQREVPGVEFRVVGRYEAPADVADLADIPGVVITGEVTDLRPHLRTATAAVVPIRYGGGTRIKILEAFAWGLPVVSTTVGAEGLSVANEEHILLADSAAALARACVRTLTDTAVRRRLISGGYDLWSHEYRWPAIAERVSTVLDSVTGRQVT